MSTIKKLQGISTVQSCGRVCGVLGTLIKARLPAAAIGDIIQIEVPASPPLKAEVIAFEDDTLLLAPLGPLRGVRVGAKATRGAPTLNIRASSQLLGRILNGLGEPIDGLAPLPQGESWPIFREAPHPLKRRPVTEPFLTGVRAIDGLLTLGRGQRTGIFSPAGAGKTMLLAQLVRQSETDIIVVALIGERGREVRSFVEETLGRERRKRSVVIVATHDSPPQVRINAALSAIAIAEYFRDRRGKDVLFLLDSLSRLARAQREIGMAAGELPIRQGYPASFFSLISQLVERSSNSDKGTITALYTVLLPESEEREDLVAEEAMSLLDGHIVLSATLAKRAHWPAIDVLRSLSRLFPKLTGKNHQRDAKRLRKMMSVYETHHDLIALGAYRRGQDRDLDEAIERAHEIEGFLCQSRLKSAPFKEVLERLDDLTA